MNYTIKKNKHYASPLQLWDKFLAVGLPHSISAEVRFAENCRYDIGADQSDINKLYGISFGLHHHNSVRIGWRYIANLDKIELVTYCYKNKVRLPEKYIKYCEFGEQVSTRIIVAENHCSFVVNGERVTSEELNVGGISYPLSLYFGGNRKAPHEMNVELNVDWE